ncbi:HypC/HybG/HupF family hydrogenase formation chaperone [Celeribacter neptunius]|uniref:Hydrogenase expression/formation protein HypC n=1 Tax=Celeribacter neptunius TaxID=588602 RepID=A0A1I3NKP6_9RHOB|nr:HypC/HybG/HupF family hydrogenase formation chaperone [Celeribacter neptunius]SFJ09520.1 hydrogenase expression/formation protein HypC [Celeribacter neptunius]
MCLSYPMKILSKPGAHVAICDRDGQQHRVDMTFLAEAEPGDWVTVHLGIAREKISEADAGQIRDALKALDMVRAGETDVDHLFSDLVDRVPPRPPVSGES